MQTPISKSTVETIQAELGMDSVSTASIREVKKLINQIEEATGQKFIRMEMGVPGMQPPACGINAQIQALRDGLAAIYPPIEGTPEFKKEAARFVKNFLDVTVSEKCCVPTVGSMQAGFAALLTVNRMYRDKEGTLFIDPGFPVQKMQCQLLGQEYRTFDVYHYRGKKLRDKLEEMMSDGRVSSLLYSNPNNPAWFCFTDEELRIIAEVADKYNVVVIEDLAYFAMDFRKDYATPGQPPYQPTVAKYTDNFILFISSSKAFSYAGERMAMVVVSDKIWNTKAPDLLRYHKSDTFGQAFQYGTIYALSSGTSHSAQAGFTAMLKASNDGTYNFVNDLREYGEKAHLIKKAFVENGFKIVYDKDGDEPVADGFYFTVTYSDFSSEELMQELLYYGISMISLEITGSNESGMRVCVSLVSREEIPLLEERLRMFDRNQKRI
ncbi:MAG: pyridoxal phosphate-dependent aminotransferase [Bacteroidales bacterium]|jgi:aspartate/methionine/tyrosine aminotransferase|nr:pyridoxal phosphate-dependent aminotransferase [Bacteroidales bacterium]